MCQIYIFSDLILYWVNKRAIALVFKINFDITITNNGNLKILSKKIFANPDLLLFHSYLACTLKAAWIFLKA